MLTQWIALFFAHFSLSMLILSLIISFCHILFSNSSNSEIIYRWIALFALGFTGIYTFIMHAFFPAVTAANIGWAVSPFQYEVAMADLTVGLLGVISFKSSLGFRFATTLASITWLWGDAIGHIRQMILHQNFTPGNAGSWFLTDLIVPLLLLITIIQIKSHQTRLLFS